MKNNLLLFNFCLLLFIGSIGQMKAVQLNGTYTINPGATASTTNFQNIRSAATYLTSIGVRADGGPANTGTVGVSGPVLFVLSAGTFNEQVSIPAITGSSTTNTITFSGASRTSTIFTFASADLNNRHTLRLNLATNVTFRDMTIIGNGATYAFVVHIMGLNSNNNKFKNCDIRVTGTGTTTTSTNYIAFLMNNSATAPTSGTRIDGTEIDSCTIESGYYGILAAGASSNLHVGLKIRNSRILDAALYPIYATFVNGITVDNNLLFPRVSYQYNYGIYLLNSICTAPNRHLISNNRIHGFGYYGIYITGSSNLSGNKGFIINNMIGGMIKYDYSRCLFLNATSQWAISNNTINHDISGFNNTYGGAYISGGSGNSFVNNICSEKVASAAIPLYATASTVFDTLNYNLFYRPDTSNASLIYVGTNYNSGNFKGAAGQNVNSIYGNPSFANDTLLLNNNACFQGLPLVYVPKDIFGSTRSATNPIMGAYETPSIPNNLAVIKITNFTPPMTSGARDMNVLVRNNGNNTVTSFNLSYTQNGGAAVVLPWSGSLGTCDTITLSFSGSQQPTIGAINNFRIYSSLPNTVNDSDRTNDTLNSNFYLPLSGTYQIGGSTPDFAKPSDAFSALQMAGVTGAVRLVVNPGTYLDQVTIDNTILGASATNNITLVGTNKNTCIIQNNNATTSARHVIRVGQSYIRIDSLTIRANNPNFGWGIHISKTGLRNIQVKNSVVDISHPSGVGSTVDAFMGIVMSGANNSPYYYDTYILDSIEIDSNTIINGYAGIWQYSYFYSYYYVYGAPSEAIKIRRNTIINPYYVGILTNGTSSLDVSGNIIKMRKTTASNYGLQIQSHDATSSSSDLLIVNNNRIIDANYMGLYLYNAKANANKRGEVYNNAVSVGFSTPNCYGMYVYSTSNTNFYSNSVLNNQISNSNTTGALYFTTNINARMRNNHFVVSKAGTMGVPAYLSGNSFSSVAEFNYNNFYRPDTSGNFVFINSWLTGKAFIGLAGNNVNSIIKNPAFIADTLLKSFNGCLNGDTISAITKDINDTIRASIPDIGAYETISVTDDLGALEVLAPTAPIQPGTQDVLIRFINYGLNTVTTANVGLKLNNSPVVTQLWSGSLASCDTTSILFTGLNQINIAAGTVNSMKIFTSAPNSNADNNTNNDTVIVILPTPMKGNYIVGSAPSDFLTITEAVNQLSIRGVDSIVNIRIKTGTYTEQLTIPAIVGSSELNRITFTSLANHVDSVIVSRSNSTTAENFIVKMNGAKYVDFNKLSLRALNASFGYVFDIAQNTGFVNVRDCKMDAPVTTTTSTNMAIVYGINNTIGNISFVKSSFTGGSYGVYFRGTSTIALSNNNVIDSNTFLNQYYMGIYNYYLSNQTIRSNTITTTSAYSAYFGIQAYYVDSAFLISRNYIYSTTANGHGMATYYCDGTPLKYGVITNNVIRMGSGSTTANYGLRESYSSYMLVSNNTVVVNTTSTTTGYAGYFYYNAAYSNTNKIRNNVFVNATTGGVLYHYNPLFGSSDFNLIFTNGTANFVQRGIVAATYTGLQAFKSVNFGDEQNSIQYRPGYFSATNLVPNPNDTAVWSVNGRGDFVSEVTVDFNGNPRPTSIQTGVFDIGAYEVTPAVMPPFCVAVPALPVAGGTQAFLFGTDTVCKVTHDISATVPSSLFIRQYTGTVPPSSSASDARFNTYINMIAPIGSYTFDLDYFYKDVWIGTVPSETDSRLAQNSPGTSWNTFSGSGSTVDSIRNFIRTSFLGTYSVFTGTDNNAPLPVALTDFGGYLSEVDAILLWQTTMEKNSASFVVERAYELGKFTAVGEIASAGNSNVLKNYLFQDRNALNTISVAYYRLKMIDKDGSFTYSKVIAIRKVTDESIVSVGPNPFKSNFMVHHIAGNINVEVMDINGKMVYNTNLESDGVAKISFPQSIGSGIYFVKISGQNQSKLFKMVKE
ncbi:MAG: right-handed parallel beta-helix repeat-containing protein [bacterium]|nr:right-handed parallel beta-helix repeat-containing protein [bacterium]